MSRNCDISELKGKKILMLEGDLRNDIIFICSDNSKYQMYHRQDCCENVSVEEIIGDINDLIDSEILMSECVTNSEVEQNQYGWSLWTFYKFATNKGYVTIRWLGESEYYSIDVDFICIQEAADFGQN